jgi:hypothetical protein
MSARRQPEKFEQRAIVRLLTTLGFEVYVLGTHRPSGDHQGTCQTKGLPDLLAFFPRGLGLLAIEVKAPGGALRPEQRVFRDRCLACEAPYKVHHVVGGQNAVIAYLVSMGTLRADQVPLYRLAPGEVPVHSIPTSSEGERAHGHAHSDQGEA